MTDYDRALAMTVYGLAPIALACLLNAILSAWEIYRTGIHSRSQFDPRQSLHD